MIINRVWSMPNKNTFNILPIKHLLQKYINKDQFWLDPFANEGQLIKLFPNTRIITNDLNPEYNTHYHLDAFNFINQYSTETIDGVVYDPPYSTRQVSETYKGFGYPVTQKTTTNAFWSTQKKEIGRVIKKAGTAISFGWNSGGIGASNGFEIVEILLVPHGGWHNDTIITVERKIK
jgi:hypothetical protein